MEYPGVAFVSAASKGKTLFWITVHEIGHTYFPMVVGANERRYAWMDEGLNTFIDVYESDAFDGGVYGPERDQEFAPGDGAPADQIAALTRTSRSAIAVNSCCRRRCGSHSRMGRRVT